MENVYIVAHRISDKSQYWSGSNIIDCIKFIRQQRPNCLYSWHIRIYEVDTGKKIYNGNLGKYIYG